MTGFPAGFVVEHDGQIYRPLGIRQHVKIDGSLVTVVDWETDCPSCGIAFEVWTKLKFRHPRRRCDGCKSPTRPVRSDRKLFREQTEGTEP